MTKINKAISQASDFKFKLQDMLRTAASGRHIGTRKFVWIGPNDFADMIKYCDLIIKNDLTKAARLQRDMDTPVYELLPYSLYNFIQEYK